MLASAIYDFSGTVLLKSKIKEDYSTLHWYFLFILIHFSMLSVKRVLISKKQKVLREFFGEAIYII